MSDLFGRLAASAVGQAPTVRPLILSRYEPGLELVAAPTVPEPVVSEASGPAVMPEAAPSTLRPPPAPSRQVSPTAEDRAEVEGQPTSSHVRRPPHRVRQGTDAIAPATPPARRNEMRQATLPPSEKAPAESRVGPANVDTRQPAAPGEARTPPVPVAAVTHTRRTAGGAAPPTVPDHEPTQRTIVETEGSSRDTTIEVDRVNVAQPNDDDVLVPRPPGNSRAVKKTDLDHPTVVSHREASAPRSEPIASATANPVRVLDAQALPEPSVIVTIGRIEVRAITRQPAAPPGPSHPPAPRLSLDAYLEEREERRR